MKRALVVLAGLVCMVLGPSLVWAFSESGGGCESDCRKCHSLSATEASELVHQINPEVEVLGITNSPVGGLWELTVSVKGRKGLAYIDFAKKHIMTGSILDVKSKENVTDRRLYDITKIDTSAIPLKDAIALGNPDAKMRVIVFSDPECPYCRKLHKELKQVVADHDDVVFFIKMLPLKIHPQAYKKAQAILCDKSVKTLDRAFDGLGLAEPTCESTELDETIALAERLGITGTPTLILPDGGMLGGFKPADELYKLIQASAAAAATKDGQPTPQPAAKEVPAKKP